MTAFFALGVFGVLSMIAYSAYGNVTRSNALSQARSMSANLLDLAVAALTAESKDLDSDGQPEAPAMRAADGVSNCSGTMAGANCFIPATSGAPKTDAWGTQIRYCAWDNGAANTATNRITDGNDTPAATQNSVVFAVVSAGVDKVFQTTCADAKADTRKGDDGYRRITVFLVVKGNGGTAYLGDSVQDKAALNTLVPANGYTPQDGQQRLVKSNGQAYYWNGTAWISQTPVAGLVVNAGDNCDAYEPGTIARGPDNETVMMCKP